MERRVCYDAVGSMTSSNSGILACKPFSPLILGEISGPKRHTTSCSSHGTNLKTGNSVASVVSVDWC